MKYLIIIMIFLNLAQAKKDEIDLLVDHANRINQEKLELEAENKMLRMQIINQGQTIRILNKENKNLKSRLEYAEQENRNYFNKFKDQIQQEPKAYNQKIRKQKELIEYKETENSVVFKYLARIAEIGAVILAIIIIFLMCKKIFKRKAKNELADY